MLFDATGQPQASTFADYLLPGAREAPAARILHMETASPYTDFGVKGIGEAGTIGATPAVQNAVVDAVSHLGVTHIDMPTTPARVWAAISAAQESEEGQ